MPDIKEWWRCYAIYSVVAGVIIVLAAFQPAASEWLQFDRAQIEQGQYWRLLTASWVHLSANHLIGNTLGVVLFAYIAGDALNNRTGLLLFFWCTLIVGAGLYFYADYLQYYVGLSGALHGFLFVAPFVSSHYSRRVALLFAFAIAAKTIWEQTPFYDDMALADYVGGRVETNSHLLGTISGFLFLLILSFFKPELIRE